MAKIGPLFSPVKQAMNHLYSRYTNQQLAVILDFIMNCDRLTQGLTGPMRGGPARAPII
jgi:hypothetical protein